MSNAMRHYEDLRGILAQQLSAAADDWSPTPRQAVQQAARSDCDAVAEPSVEAVDGKELRMDDIAAVLKRSFDYDAAEWLLSLLAVTTVREIH